MRKMLFINFLLVPVTILNAQTEKIAPVIESIPDGYVLIEGGSFIMGSPSDEPGRDDDEVRHHVTVSSF